MKDRSPLGCKRSDIHVKELGHCNEYKNKGAGGKHGKGQSLFYLNIIRH